jgi:hypothetical protein
MIGLPESAYLGKRVSKKLFFDNGALTTADKKLFQDDVESIVWQYGLKSDNIQVKPYTDEQREYLEVAILDIVLRSPKSYRRLAEVIHRTIPYPLLLVFSQNPDVPTQDLQAEENLESSFVNNGSKISLSIAPKRFSLAEKGAIVAEEFFTTEWMDMESPTDIEQLFLENLNIKDLPHTDFFDLYSALIDRFIAFDCASFRGEFRLNGKHSPEMLREQLAMCHELKGKISDMRKRLSSETQFNNKLELNMRIKQIEKQLKNESALL